MQRRELILLLTGAMTAARPLRAQQKAMPVIGWLSVFSPPANFDDWLRGPIHRGLSEAGFVEGQNMMSKARWAEGHYDRLPALAMDLVSHKVDLIITSGGAPPALAAKNATSTIPIVFTDVGDPVGFGLVASLARPGGNVTGFGNLTVELEPKQIELLSELVPQAAVIALLVNPDNAMAEQHIRTTQEGAAREGHKARGPEGEDRSRDRRRLRATASRCAPRQRRCVLLQPTRAACLAGSATHRSGDLLGPMMGLGRRSDQLWR